MTGRLAYVGLVAVACLALVTPSAATLNEITGKWEGFCIRRSDDRGYIPGIFTHPLYLNIFKKQGKEYVWRAIPETKIAALPFQQHGSGNQNQQHGKDKGGMQYNHNKGNDNKGWDDKQQCKHDWFIVDKDVTPYALEIKHVNSVKGYKQVKIEGDGAVLAKVQREADYEVLEIQGYRSFKPDVGGLVLNTPIKDWHLVAKDEHAFYYKCYLKRWLPRDLPPYPCNEEEESSMEPEESSKKPEESSKKPEESSQKPEESSQKPEESSQKPEESSQKPEESSQKPEESSQKPEESSQKPEESSQKPEESSQKPEESSQKPEESSQKPEESSQKPEESSQKPEESSQKPEESSQEPEESSQKPEESSQKPEESSQKPEESSQKPEESSQKPEESSQVPEESKKEDIGKGGGKGEGVKGEGGKGGKGDDGKDKI